MFDVLLTPTETRFLRCLVLDLDGRWNVATLLDDKIIVEYPFPSYLAVFCLWEYGKMDILGSRQEHGRKYCQLAAELDRRIWI